MIQSHVIEVNGVFIGAAVPLAGGFRFRAVHPQVDDLDGFSWSSLQELRHATGYLFRTSRLRTVTTDGHAIQDTNAARHSASRAEPPHRPSPAAPWTPR